MSNIKNLKNKDFVYCYNGYGVLGLHKSPQYHDKCIYQILEIEQGGLSLMSVKNGERTRINNTAFRCFFSKLVVL